VKDREEKTKAQLDHHKASGKRRNRWDKRMVHVLVHKTAREMAGAYYEHAAHDNTFYHYYPSQKFFIDYEWHRFIAIAKQTLATMLSNPATPEAHKQDIYHALVLDATLPYAQNETQITNFRH
jgi:hypothetical protein